MSFVLSQTWLGNRVNVIIDATFTDDTEDTWEHFSQALSVNDLYFSVLNVFTCKL